MPCQQSSCMCSVRVLGCAEAIGVLLHLRSMATSRCLTSLVPKVLKVAKVAPSWNTAHAVPTRRIQRRIGPLVHPAKHRYHRTSLIRTWQWYSGPWELYVVEFIMVRNAEQKVLWFTKCGTATAMPRDHSSGTNTAQAGVSAIPGLMHCCMNVHSSGSQLLHCSGVMWAPDTGHGHNRQAGGQR